MEEIEKTTGPLGDEKEMRDVEFREPEYPSPGQSFPHVEADTPAELEVEAVPEIPSAAEEQPVPVVDQDPVSATSWADTADEEEDDIDRAIDAAFDAADDDGGDADGWSDFLDEDDAEAAVPEASGLPVSDPVPAQETAVADEPEPEIVSVPELESEPGFNEVPEETVVSEPPVPDFDGVPEDTDFETEPVPELADGDFTEVPEETVVDMASESPVSEIEPEAEPEPVVPEMEAVPELTEEDFEPEPEVVPVPELESEPDFDKDPEKTDISEPPVSDFNVIPAGIRA